MTGPEKALAIITTLLPALISMGSGIKNLIANGPAFIASLSGMTVA
jgi:hypothetical protein